jgi:hypothetical protein
LCGYNCSSLPLYYFNVSINISKFLLIALAIVRVSIIQILVVKFSNTSTTFSQQVEITLSKCLRQCYERQMHTFVFILFNAYSHQINHECLTCAKVPDTRCTFMCLTCSVVLTENANAYMYSRHLEPLNNLKHKYTSDV